jgi:predicted dehydrogenase
MAHLLTAVAERRSVAPEGADFRDGYRAVAVAEAVAQSAMQGGAVTVSSDGV